MNHYLMISILVDIGPDTIVVPETIVHVIVTAHHLIIHHHLCSITDQLYPILVTITPTIILRMLCMTKDMQTDH
jgi:hypothetical protein